MPQKLQVSKIRIPAEQGQSFLNALLKNIKLHCPFCGSAIREHRAKPGKKTYRCKHCKTVIYNPKVWLDDVLQNYQGWARIKKTMVMKLSLVKKKL
jgi:predicted RNA-binding Zn-ribbon protein involved in translation (DUF1610 family)